MFWKGKVSFWSQVEAYVKDADLTFATITKPELSPTLNPNCSISAASLTDVSDIAKLLNEFFEPVNSRAKTAVTAEWIRSTYLANNAIWIIAKDRAGTIRGCVSSFRSVAPYANSLGGCGISHPWGVVDWFCVHPLWRSKGVGSSLLEALDLITYRLGRKAHVFLKEGLPLPLPHIPVYATFLLCRRAGNKLLMKPRENTSLVLHPYHTVDNDTGLNLIKVEGLRWADSKKVDIDAWENALNTEIPPCIVFVSMADAIDPSKGWKTDSLVSMYAFRWVAGKWLFSVPNKGIV